mgnify:CR=1 FL=1
MKTKSKITSSIIIVISILAAAVFQACAITKAKGEENKGFPPSDAYKLMYEDEFNGKELNTADWMYRTGERLGGLNLPENVRIADGKLYIDYKKEIVDGKEWYTGGGIISKHLFGYGYYEVKSKLYGGTGGLHSSFWLLGLNNVGDGVNYPILNQVIEIDGYEVDSHKPERVYPNLHYYVGRHTGVGGVKEHIIDTSADYVVHGFEWLPNKIRWYVNGKMVGELENPEFYAPQNVWLTALACPGAFGGYPDDSKLPGFSTWEYFKFYARDLVGANLTGNSSFEYNTNKDYENNYKRNVQIPVSWIESGDNDASFIVETNSAYDGDCILKHHSDKPYKVETKQNLEFISNGTYKLTAMVRSSGGQKEAKMKVSGKGIKEQSVDIDATGSTWTKITIDNIEVTKSVCTISFYSDAEAGQWLEIDDVVFAMASGNDEINNDEINLEMNLPVKTYEFPGAIIADNAESSKFTKSGTWSESSLKGNIGSSLYSNSLSAFAQWKVDIPLTANYKVYFYNIGYENNMSKVKLEVTCNGETTVKEIDHKVSGSSWVELGEYNLEKGSKVTVKLSPGENMKGGYFRADCIKIVPVNALNIKDALIMKVDSNIAYKEMKKLKINRENPEITPYVENGEVFLPVNFIYECFDMDAVNSKDAVNLEADSNGFASMKAVEEALGKKVFYDSSGLIIISEHDNIFDPEEDKGIIAQIIKELF